MSRDREVALAEERGAERVRDQVRAVLEEGRRVVRVGEREFEVVPVSDLEQVLDPDAGTPV